MSYRIRFHAGLALDRLSALFSVPLRCTPRGTAADLAERASAPGSLELVAGGRRALLCYGRPSVRGRRVFGDLVPYGELWRMGANEPTVLHLPFPATVAGIRVRRGKLALYAIPDPESWTLVLNRSTRQSGRTRPERGRRGNLFPSAYTASVAGAELGRAAVETRTIPHVERLTVRSERVHEGRTLLLVEWERTQVRIPLER